MVGLVVILYVFGVGYGCYDGFECVGCVLDLFEVVCVYFYIDGFVCGWVICEYGEVFVVWVVYVFDGLVYVVDYFGDFVCVVGVWVE